MDWGIHVWGGPKFVQQNNLSWSLNSLNILAFSHADLLESFAIKLNDLKAKQLMQNAERDETLNLQSWREHIIARMPPLWKTSRKRV